MSADEEPGEPRRRDPRDRPPDPAGTQPKHDPASLIPERLRRNALGPGGASEEATLPVLAAGAELDTLGGAPSPAMFARQPALPKLRFRGLLLVLALLAGGAITGIVVIGSERPPQPPKPWSTWAPNSSGADPAQQIAEHVGPEYKSDTGHQLVQLTGGPPVVQGQRAVVGIDTSGNGPTPLAGDTVVYTMCGSGTGCSISGGTASQNRTLLVMREALELALYTFHYESSANNAVVLLPPSPADVASAAASGGTPASHAVLFEASRLRAALVHPLAKTLRSPAPLVSTVHLYRDSQLVLRVTKDAIYDVQQTVDTSSGAPVGIVLLVPPGPTG